jgi:hypothetical protein
VRDGELDAIDDVEESADADGLFVSDAGIVDVGEENDDTVSERKAVEESVFRGVNVMLADADAGDEADNEG